MVRAGRLRERVTVQRNTPSRSASGEKQDSWGAVATVWAAVEPMEGRELFGSDIEMSEQPTKFTLRWGAGVNDLTVRDRIVFDSTNYDLVSVVNVGRRDRSIEAVGVVRE